MSAPVAVSDRLVDEGRQLLCSPNPWWGTGSTDAAVRQFNARVDAGNLTKAWGVAKTNSWYKNRFGRASQTWPFSLLEYWRLTEQANLSDYEMIQTKAY